MKRVGILTFYNNYNFGSYLQAYALQSAVYSLGYSPVIIDFSDYSKRWNKRLRNKTLANRFLCCARHPWLLFELYKTNKTKSASLDCSQDLKKKFNSFSERFLDIFSEDYLHSEFSAFITGSDQVWKLTIPGLHYALFLRFAPSGKRISYAASLGCEMVPSFNRKLFIKYLSGFSAISVREDSSVDLISRLSPDFNPQLVLDPVLLVGKEFWMERTHQNSRGDYIFVYFLDVISPELLETFNRFLDDYPCITILMVDTGVRISNRNIRYISPSPLEFVSLIEYSRCVITDSFHGSAFSLLFGVDFYTFSRNYQMFPGQSGRIKSLFRLFGCQDRLIISTTKKSEISPIDWSFVDEVLIKMQSMSFSFLKDALITAEQH